MLIPTGLTHPMKVKLKKSLPLHRLHPRHRIPVQSCFAVLHVSLFFPLIMRPRHRAFLASLVSYDEPRTYKEAKAHSTKREPALSLKAGTYAKSAPARYGANVGAAVVKPRMVWAQPIRCNIYRDHQTD